MATKPWDGKMKRVLTEIPQDTVDWLLAGAKFISILSSELEDETIYTDLLLEISIDGQRNILHVEIQRNRDSHMAERLWEYNVKTSLKYKCSVLSVVIYLKDDGKVAEAPFTRKLSNGRYIHNFDFDVVKLWELPTAYFQKEELIGLLPLLPLTREGARREIIEEVISRLMPPNEEPKAELLTLTYGLASLILINEADQEWLIRRFGQMNDILQETRAYRELIKDGLEQGLQQGLKEGLQQGLKEGLQQGLQQGRQEEQQVKMQEMRDILLEVILELFPQIRIPAQEQVDAITDTLLLQQLIVKMHSFKTSEEALHYLREINAYNKKS